MTSSVVHNYNTDISSSRQCRLAVRWPIALLWMLALTLLATSCSLTRHLPPGETLYVGVARIDHHRSDTTDEVVAQAVAQALEVQPNSALLGSAYHMSPLPIGLWLYNGLYTERTRGLRHWLWSSFKSDPTLVSQVNPSLRARAAEAALKDEGYFDATVTYATVPHHRDSLRARIAYDVTYRHQSRLGSIRYLASRHPRIDSIVTHTLGASLLHTGQRFSASLLDAERQRIAQTLQDSGYYFFRPEHIRLVADTLGRPNTVDLRLIIGAGAEAKALSPCTIDSVHYHLDYGASLRTRMADTLRFMTVGYNGNLLVKPRYLRRALGFRRHALCTPDRLSLTKTLNARLDVFKYTTTSLQVLREANDSLPGADTTSLRLLIDATYNAPWSGTTEVGCVYKDNQQMGPGITSTITRRNLWGGGEKLSMQFTGSYEWRTGDGAQGTTDALPNSYELGEKVSLTVPRLQLPRLFRPDRESPVSSSYSLSFDWMRRAGLFEMVKAGGQVTYDFGLNRRNTFSITPFKIAYVSTLRRSPHFDEMLTTYASLRHSFEDQFIPQVQASWTYDNSQFYNADPLSPGYRSSKQYVNITLAEAGGLIDVAMGQFGTHRLQGERQLFFQPFSQFLKATAELRDTRHLARHLTLASRLMAGVGYAYGNSTVLPYSEQFYIGGPNSLRGFRVRGIGPGAVSYFTELPDRYAYLDRVGDLKLEGNVELRFPLAGSLHGALFVDAGNVWRLRHSDQSKGETFQGQDLIRQLALDCGYGFRLDLGMLVMRLDLGLPLHDPSLASSTSSYFNRRHAMLRQIEWNLAVGYPF